MAKVVFMCRHYRNTFELPDDMKVSDAIEKFTHKPCMENVRWMVNGASVSEGTPRMEMTLAECADSQQLIFINKICELVDDKETERKWVYCTKMKV